jgi:hypothetical protein
MRQQYDVAVGELKRITMLSCRTFIDLAEPCHTVPDTPRKNDVSFTPNFTLVGTNDKNCGYPPAFRRPGDLAQRMLLPSLCALHAHRLLPAQLTIVCAARTQDF